MRLIESSVIIIPQENTLEGIYKQCELAGRTAYKSEDRITEGSAKKFVESLMKLKHGAVLEHGTIYLKIGHTSPVADKNYMKAMNTKMFYTRNKYSKVTDRTEDHFHHDVYITTNLRVVFENDRMDDLQYLCEPTEYHEKRITAKFICSRSIAQEITRHRTMSFLMESQRYVAYNKDKFGGEITYIIPQWVIDEVFSWADSENPLTGERYEYLVRQPLVESVWEMQCLDRTINAWLDSLAESESTYMYLVGEGERKAEEARSVLPNDCKTELIVTGFASDWKHFFDLRSKGTTGKPHPDIKILADTLLLEFINKGYYVED